ncbi:hypothetical protein [Streptomyces triticirhizae]|uniref:DUF3592 domain-containing protein n=1 Tax=Streptomyces triticirhizae TaxID=2483353 RepID=A0A3M2LER3_9ACTN|nr:hypothetical protein [Streptomyces triticirhizae]RMI33178.1 hypothetical protein EBN88_24495 [Streptomyces triticirhizae]
MEEQARQSGPEQLPPWPPALPVELADPRYPPGVTPEVGEAAARLLRRVLSPLRLLGHMTLAVSFAIIAVIFVVTSESSADGDEMNAQTGLAVGLPMLAVATLLLILLLRSGHRAVVELNALMRHVPQAVPPMPGRRALWGAASGLGLLICLACGATGISETVSGSDGEPPDVYKALGLFSWTAVALLWSVPGLVRAFGHRAPSRPPMPAIPPAGWAPLGMPAPPPDSHEGRTRRLYASYRSPAEPFALSRLSERLSRWITSLSRSAVLALSASLTLVGCGLAVLAAVVPWQADDWLIWPLLVALIGYLVLLLMEITHYGTRPGYMVLYMLAGVALVVMSWQGHQDLTLRERGEWATAEIVSKRSPARGSTTCEVRLIDTEGGAAGAGRVLSQRLSNCRSLAPGDRLDLFYDPLDRVPPAREEPTLAMPAWFGGIGATTLLATTLFSVSGGYARRRELDLLT